MTMSYRRLFRAVPTCAAWALLAGAALAVAPEVRDGGKFFSPEAVKKADEQIREIYRKHHQDVLIETFQSVPADQAEKVKAMDGKARTEFYSKWANDRAKERVVNGVYILITKEPRYLYAEVIYSDAAARDRKALPKDFYKTVRDAMIAEFAKGRFDDGLQAALRAVEQQLGKSGK
jgi:uncharacterized membrane protein YgcG